MSAEADLRCITTRGLHELTGVNMSTLRMWRAAGKRPHSFRVGGVVLYRLTEVEAWLADAEATELASTR